MNPLKAFLLCAVLAMPSYTHAQTAAPEESEVKAAFIYNFAKFVEWPLPSSPEIMVCMLGDGPVDEALGNLDGKSIGDRKLKVRRITSRNVRDCDLLFVGAPEKQRLEQILDTAREAGILTIGDAPGLAQQGVMLNFYLLDNKVRFEINLEAANRAGVKISSKLIQLGKMVSTSK